MLRSKCILECAALCVLVAAPAKATILAPYEVTGSASFNLNPPEPLTLEDFGSRSLADERFGAVSVTALGMPSPIIVADASLGPSSIGFIYGRGVGALNYRLEIVGPPGEVPVVIDVAGAATASAGAGASFAVESRWDLLDATTPLAGDDIRSGQLSGDFDESFARAVSLTLATNHVYSMFLIADAAAAASAVGSSATGHAFIDAVWSLGPGVDPLSYSFHFSDGIGNVRSTGVPRGHAPGPAARVPTLGGALSAPYPNPFNPRTALELSLPQAGRVFVGLYDTRGRLVAAMADQEFPAGLQTLTWTGTDRAGLPVGSGVYVTRLVVDGREQLDGRHRLVLVR